MKGQLIQSFLVEMLPSAFADEAAMATIDAIDVQDAREKIEAQFPCCIILRIGKFEEAKNSFLFEE